MPNAKHIVLAITAMALGALAAPAYAQQVDTFSVEIQTPFVAPPVLSGDNKTLANENNFGDCRMGNEKGLSIETAVYSKLEEGNFRKSTTCERTTDNTFWRFHKNDDGTLGVVQVIQGSDGFDILDEFIRYLYLFLAGLIGIFSVLMIVIGGVQIATAGANQEGLDGGKTRILSALAGLALLFLSSLILRTINPTFFS